VSAVYLIADIDETPAPGAYDYKLSQLTPHYSIGLPIKTNTSNNPPPNAYDIKDGVGTSPTHRRSIPAWGVRSRSFFGSCYYDGVKAAVPGIGPPLMLLRNLLLKMLISPPIRKSYIYMTYPSSDMLSITSIADTEDTVFVRDTQEPSTYTAWPSSCYNLKNRTGINNKNDLNYRDFVICISTIYY